MQQKIGPGVIAAVAVVLVLVLGVIAWKVFAPETGKVGNGNTGNAKYDAYTKDPVHNGLTNPDIERKKQGNNYGRPMSSSPSGSPQ